MNASVTDSATLRVRTYGDVSLVISSPDLATKHSYIA